VGYSQDYIPLRIFPMIYQLTSFQIFQKGLMHVMYSNGPLHQIIFSMESTWSLDGQCEVHEESMEIHGEL
jgi:hypothetical protein